VREHGLQWAEAQRGLELAKHGDLGVGRVGFLWERSCDLCLTLKLIQIIALEKNHSQSSHVPYRKFRSDGQAERG
jgi:hypothetical protein